MNALKLMLAKKNREADPASWDALYGRLVSNKFRKRYTQDAVEAIVNNYLGEPTDEKYIAEFKAMQEYREQCKAEVKEELGET